MTPEDFAEIYRKYIDGDPITDKELKEAIPYLSEKVEFLRALGERFHLVWHNLIEVQMGLEGFVERRAIYGRKKQQ